MAHLRSVIIDDEQKSRESIAFLLSKYCPEVEVCAMADSLQEGYQLIRKENPSLIFLDIQLNSEDGTGIDLISSLHLEDCAVIFISGFRDYAAEAFRLKAVDYLLKPVRIDQLTDAIGRARKFLGDNRKTKSTSRTERGETFHIPAQNGFVIVKYSDVIRCEASGSYTYFYVKGRAERITSSVNIGQVEQKLNDDFFRVHKSHIINRDYLLSYSKTEGLLLKMADNVEIPVSRAQKDAFMKWLDA